MSYPIHWLDETFRSRATTEQLLRPDLDSGLITLHDFNLASSFLPGHHRYWPYGCAALASGGAAGYSRLYRTRKPPLSLNRSVLLATVAGFCGSVYGQFRRAKAHWTFTQELDDPVAFTQALENVNKRTGGVRPLAWSLQRALEVTQKEDMHGNISRPQEDVWAPNADPPVSSHPEPPQEQLSPSSSKPASRWDELRAANTRAMGQSSSWDSLRQQHERQRVVKKSEAAYDRFDVVDRAEEQARFDALVEAERKMASQ